MNELLKFIFLHKWKILGGLFTAIIAPLIVFWIQKWWQKGKPLDESSEIKTGKITAGKVSIAGRNIIHHDKPADEN